MSIQISFTPVNGLPLTFDVKSVVWHYEPLSVKWPVEPLKLNTTHKVRMRLRRKFRKAIRHAGRNTTPMKLRRIRK